MSKKVDLCGEYESEFSTLIIRSDGVYERFFSKDTLFGEWRLRQTDKKWIEFSDWLSEFEDSKDQFFNSSERIIVSGDSVLMIKFNPDLSKYNFYRISSEGCVTY
jgi:hypothetical protein